MATKPPPHSKHGQMQTRVLKEGVLVISTDCQSGTDKWDKANSKKRYCILQRRDGRLSLKVYDSDKKTGMPHKVRLDTALKAAKWGRCQVVTEDGTVLCVMEGDERKISDWVVSLNSVTTTARADKDITQHTDSETDKERETDRDRETDTDSETAEREDAGTAPNSLQKLSEKPEVIKEGWLNIHTDSAPVEYKRGKVRRRYCVLQRQWHRYTLEVYKREDDRHSRGPKNWTGNVATVCLDTARHDQLCSTLCEVVTKNDGTLCVIYGTDDVVTDWVVSLNRAIMDTRCQGNSESHGDGRRDDSDDGALRTLSLAQAENEFMLAWFPKLDTESYIIPRVHYGTVNVFDNYIVGGREVKVLKTDEAIKKQRNEQNKEVSVVTSIDDILKRVHYTMHTIKEENQNLTEGKEDSGVMVIMTEVKCGLYNNLYAGAADRNNKNMERGGASRVTKWDMKHDLADLLVIHRDHGLLLGAVIRNKGAEGFPTLCEDMENAVAYLDNTEDLVNKTILPGVAGGSAVAVNKTILLPNLTRANLETTIKSLQPEVRERLERCVGVQPGYDVSRMCLTNDDMADKKRRKEWWTACLKRDTQRDTARMGEEVYRALVASFVVPLTTVEMSLSTQPRLQLWTAGHVIHAVGEEHGRDLTRIALFPRQVELLEDTPDDDDDDVRILHGGPGTAKTILLLLRGESWSRDGCDRVFNIQTEKDGQAAAYLVSHQLRETVARARQGDTVARPDFTVQHVNMAPWWDSDKKVWTKKGQREVAAWCDDAARSEDGKVHIIADEADSRIISHLYRELKRRKCTVKLWAAGVDLEIPRDMKCYERKITAPLRCPPSVVREVEQADGMKYERVPRYTKPPVAPPCDGPPVITITHYGEHYSGDREWHQAEGDDDDVPWQCEECGRRVAHLLHTLHPGEQGGLRYNDVFIMGPDIDCGPDTHDDDRDSPAPFIRGLRQLGIPTRVVHDEDSEAVRRVAENSWTPLAVADAVTIVEQRTVWGLERKVVVFLDWGPGGDVADRTGRLRSMSRSTAQLVWVKPEL